LNNEKFSYKSYEISGFLLFSKKEVNIAVSLHKKKEGSIK